MSITYVDVINPARDLGRVGRKTGFTVGEGYIIERVEGGAAFRISHSAPERRNDEPRRVPITNVSSYGDSDDAPKAAMRDPRVDDGDGDYEVRREGGTVHIGRAPEPAKPAKGRKK